MVRSVKHAQHGVLAWKTSTPPAHRYVHAGPYPPDPARGADLAAISPDRFWQRCGVDVPKGSYETITAQDLKKGRGRARGRYCGHQYPLWTKYGLEYPGEAPGLTEDGSVAGREGAAWCRWTPFGSPLATFHDPTGPDPRWKRLAGEYEKATGLDPEGTRQVEHRWKDPLRVSPLIIQPAAIWTRSPASGPPSWLLPGSSSTAMPASSALWRWSTPTAPVGLTRQSVRQRKE